MELSEVLKYLNKEQKLTGRQIEKKRRHCDVYYGMSLHTSGACPMYKDLTTGRYIYPPNYFGRDITTSYTNNPYQILFDFHLFSRYPRESEEMRSWRYSQYRPLQKAAFAQIMELISSSIFQDSNYTIDVPDGKDNEYIYLNKFSGYDLIGYFATIGLKHICEDPNGLFVRIPAKPYYEQTGERVEVAVLFAGSKDIIFYDQDNLVFAYEYEGIGYWITKTTIWRFYKDFKTKRWYVDTKDENGYYAHMFDKLPCTVAGGEWNTQEGGYFESFLDKAKPIADEFIATFSAAQMVDKDASHPFIVAQNEECGECHGQQQRQYCSRCNTCPDDGRCGCGEERSLSLGNCKTCGGSGKSNVYPGKWMLLDKEDFKGGGGVKIVNPDVSINKQHRETVKYLFEQLLHALNIYNTDKSESGTAKSIDQERLYKFISKISNHLFDKVIYDTLGDIIAYRNATSYNGVVTPAQYPFQIQKPTRFQMETAADLLKKYDEGTKANMPNLIRKRMAKEYAEKAYSGDEILKKTMDFINYYDSLNVYGIDELVSLRATGAATTDEIIISQKLPMFIETAIENKSEKWFLNASFKDIEAAIKPDIDKALQTRNPTFEIDVVDENRNATE